MNSKTQKQKHNGVIRARSLVPCRILNKDIEEMDYWLNEAPMSDYTRQNAFLFALNRLLRPQIETKLVQRCRGGFRVHIGNNYALDLSDSLGEWLQDAFTGHQVEPFTEWALLPWELLRPRVQKSLARYQAENASRIPLATPLIAA